MTHRRRTALRALAGGLATMLPLALLSGCDDKAPDGSNSQSAKPSSTTSTATPSSGGADANPPVASFDPKAHQQWTKDVPTSPDRTNFTSDARPEGFTEAPDGSGVDRYLGQKLVWKSCDDLLCASVKVPLDWDKPDGQAITLKMAKRPAASKRKGTLFINPGGPGGSGQEYVASFNADGLSDYDILGWDPRGSGESTPVKCGTDAQTDALNDLDASPDTEQEWQELINGMKGFAKQCRDASGPLLDHISTIDNVRDLDFLRHLVGDQKLHYMGVSYGTYIGATYAELYPSRAGHLVLDSAVNITDKDSVNQAMGFDLALGNYAQWCTSNALCSSTLGGSKQAVIDKLTDFLNQLDQHPIGEPGPGQLTQTKATLGIATMLYTGEKGYTPLTTVLMTAMTLKKAEGLVYLADQMNGKEDGHYTAMAYAFPGIACADSPDEGLKGAREEWPKVEKQAPFFGKFMGPGLQCTYWSAKPVAPYKLQGKGASPILVLGATGDPATPYQQSQWMAEQLESGVLLTWKGAGHGVYSLGNTCAKNAVQKFFNEDAVPRKGTTC